MRASICSYFRANGQLNAKRGTEHGSDFREMAMHNKLMFVALGYVLLLAALGFG
jgi:hypothetical protein